MASHEPSIIWERTPPPPIVALDLWSAARVNLPGELLRLLDAGYPIDERDHRGYAPLMIAAYHGNLEALDVLLARDADPNTTDLFGNTALMGAAFKGHLVVVLRLLAAGADANRTNAGGLDARGMALCYKRTEVFAVLRQFAPAEAHFGALGDGAVPWAPETL